ncbi:MAG: response regulator [Lachnospiraceae bacterium]|nr:response regulator [Lachnospiraceae bacterium]
MNTEKSKDEKKLVIRNSITAILMIIFFSAIILMYYGMLYRAQRTNIIKEGEMTAEDAADHIDSYLSTNTDAVKLASYTLDGMLRSHRSDSEIQDYMVVQSTAVRSAVIENMTGLYGYINGRFVSGTKWVPPEDYVATDRPWYTNAMAHPGEVAILDPYVDVQSGNVMLALGKTLCDGESVLSLDVSLDQVQQLTEDAVSNGNADIQMLLNEKGLVVAHSDKNEVGSNYFEEQDGIGYEISKRLTGEDRYHFDFKYDGARYIVYVVRMQNDWSCISVKDATSIFGSLYTILFVTIFAVASVIILLSIFMTRSNRYLHMSARAMAENEAKSEFLSKMSHELRTPINAMLGMSEMIIRESKEPESVGYSKNIRTAGRKLLGLVDKLLDISKIEAGDVEDMSIDFETIFDETEESADGSRESFRAPGARILVVDDNPMNLTVFKSLISHTEVIIDTADSGDEGIRLTLGNKYDIIFLDHMMPEKDGIETLHEIREDHDNPNDLTPVIVLTANAISGARDEYQSAGFDDYLTKPIDPVMLEETMRSYLPEDMVEVYEVSAQQQEPLPEELKVLADGPIDAVSGIKNAGSVKSYMPLLKIFYESIDDRAGEIKRYYDAEDYKNYTVKVHALKSSARIVGAADFGEEAQRLEDAGKAGDIDYIRAHHEAFMDEYEGYKTLLSQVFKPSVEDDNRPEADEEMIAFVFEEARSAAEDMDCDRLEAIFEETSAYRIPVSNAEKYERIREAASQFDYEGIIRILDEGE